MLKSVWRSYEDEEIPEYSILIGGVIQFILSLGYRVEVQHSLTYLGPQATIYILMRNSLSYPSYCMVDCDGNGDVIEVRARDGKNITITALNAADPTSFDELERLINITHR